jgi:hypothetical protein
MAHGHSLNTHQLFVYRYHSKTNEISFTTHPLDIAYYVLMYHITVWFLFSSPCQTWWWPYNKRAETCCLSSDSYILIKFCCVLTYPPYKLRYCTSLYVLQYCGSMCFRLWCVYWVHSVSLAIQSCNMCPNKVKRGHYAVILTQLNNSKSPFLSYFDTWLI